MAASQKRLEDEMADDENSSEENGHDSELPEDTASALQTSSNADVVKEDSTSEIKFKSILKKSKENDDTPAQSKSEFNECPVCLGPVMFPVRTACGHVFCFLCIKGAARQTRRCPMCRQHIPNDFDKNPVILERQEVETLDDGYQWFYEGKNGWWQYDKRTSQEIEHHYKLNLTKFDVLICGIIYTIDLNRYVQYSRDHPARKRNVKRENASKISVKGIAGVF